MSKFIRFSRFNREKFKTSPKESLRKRRLGFFKLKTIIIGLIIIGGIFYLVQTNKVAVEGFQIKELNQRIEDLRQENRKLEIEAASLQSISEIKKASQDLNLVKAEKIEYIEAGASAVALGE